MYILERIKQFKINYNIKIILIFSINLLLSFFSVEALPSNKIDNQNAFLTLDSSTTRLNIGPFLSYTVAASSDKTPKELNSRPDVIWHPISSESVNLGFTDKTFWVKGNIKTLHLRSNYWILEQSYPLMDFMDVYFFSGDTLVASWKSGDRYAFTERPVQQATFTFPIKFESDTDYTLYIKFNNTDALELPLALYEYTEYISKNNSASIIDGMFYGFLIIMAAYNFILYLTLKEKCYFYYVCYVLSIVLFLMSQKGILLQYLFPQAPLIHHYSVPIIIVICTVSITMFFKEFLNLPVVTPKAWTFAKYIIAINLLNILLLIVIPYRAAIFMINGAAALASIVALLVVLSLAKRGNRTAQIILGGWTFLIICIVFMTLSKTGVIYNEFMATYGLRIGASFEVLIFSFALSFRINEEREAKKIALESVSQERSERLKAQELALQHEIEANLAKELVLVQQQQVNENLENMVQDRTRSLERAMRDLEKVNADLELANLELEKLSVNDGLTGISNRRKFDERSKELWVQSYREQRPLSLLLIDIDHFKGINDTRGHQCGDHVLKELAQMLRTQIKRPDDLVARFGGEEFVVVLPNTPAQGAMDVANNLLKQTSELQFTWLDSALNITISIGIQTALPERMEGLDQLIADADTALYRAKMNGRNQLQVGI